MATKILKIAGVLAFLVLLYACPNVDCMDTIESYQSGLVKISPLQNSYRVGDEIIYSIVIPSANNYFGSSIDLYNETRVQSTMLRSSDIGNLKNNTLELINGENKLINNYITANLTYYQAENEYRYRIKVKFLTVGNYKIYAKNLQIHFQKKNDYECLTYNIRTNIDGITTDFFEFEVVP